jgi:hypothetical protein
VNIERGCWVFVFFLGLFAFGMLTGVFVFFIYLCLGFYFFMELYFEVMDVRRVLSCLRSFCFFLCVCFFACFVVVMFSLPLPPAAAAAALLLHTYDDENVFMMI